MIAMNLDHALGGGLIALVIVGGPILLMVALARAAGRPRPHMPRDRKDHQS